MKKTTILSLDGGGIRGIITCIILRYIEEQLQYYDKPSAKLGDYFDLVAGSSTGGLIASIILCPDETGKQNILFRKDWNCMLKRAETSSRFPFGKNWLILFIE
jgi:patatin-like phospholipase/acyl hydrolase